MYQQPKEGRVWHWLFIIVVIGPLLLLIVRCLIDLGRVVIGIGERDPSRTDW